MFTTILIAAAVIPPPLGLKSICLPADIPLRATPDVKVDFPARNGKLLFALSLGAQHGIQGGPQVAGIVRPTRSGMPRGKDGE
jgi:hypothetical protein